MSEEDEFAMRVHGCELVQEAAVLLKASQQVACTGQVLLHRFYAKRSMVKFDVRRVAATSVFSRASSRSARGSSATSSTCFTGCPGEGRRNR